MVNFPIWDQCKSEYLLKLEAHLENKDSEQDRETLGQVRQELDKREEQTKVEKK